MDLFRFWLVAVMFVYIHEKCSSFSDKMVLRALLTHQMDKKESSFMGLVDFEAWKETAPSIRKFRFSVKVNIYLKPCMYLKSEHMNSGFSIWKTRMCKIAHLSWNSETTNMWKVPCHPPGRHAMIIPFRTP